MVAYYGFAKYLPASTSPITHWARKIRRMICRPIFDKCGDNVNVERGALGCIVKWIITSRNHSLILRLVCFGVANGYYNYCKPIVFLMK